MTVLSKPPTEQKKCVQPKRGENHGLFGYKYVKQHLMHDPGWMSSDKIEQYKSIITLNQKNDHLRGLRLIDQRRKTKIGIKDLRRDVRHSHSMVKKAVCGDMQRLKNIFANSTELPRTLQRLPVPTIAEKLNQLTFIKRKELDRVRCTNSELARVYKNNVLDIARLQDRFKYIESNNNFEEAVLGRKHQMLIKESQGRYRLSKIINIAFKKLIEIMLHDSIYFETILRELEGDINEQEEFISSTHSKGIPAFNHITQLTSEYNHKRKTDDSPMRLATLVSYRQRIIQTNAQVLNLIRRDSDFEISKDRYTRQTTSMVSLNSKLNDLEKVITKLKAVTTSFHSTDILPRIVQQAHDSHCMEQNVLRNEREVDETIEKEAHSRVVMELVDHNLTNEEIDRLNQINILKSDIEKEKKEENRYKNLIKDRGEVSCYIRSSLQQIVDVLKHVEGNFTPNPIVNPSLDLPLLKFDGLDVKAKPPKGIDEDPKDLLEMVNLQVSKLMTEYKKYETKDDPQKEVEFHNAIVSDLSYEEEMLNTFEEYEPITFIDGSVPTRAEIKKKSRLFVEECLRLAELM